MWYDMEGIRPPWTPRAKRTESLQSVQSFRTGIQEDSPRVFSGFPQDIPW